jgi:outer membrane protein TolC
MLATVTVTWNSITEATAQSKVNHGDLSTGNAGSELSATRQPPRLPDSILKNSVSNNTSQGRVEFDNNTQPQWLSSPPLRRGVHRWEHLGEPDVKTERSLSWDVSLLQNSPSEDWASFGSRSLLVSESHSLPPPAPAEVRQPTQSLQVTTLNPVVSAEDIAPPKPESSGRSELVSEISSPALNREVVFPVTLRQAISHSLTQKQVIHTLAGQVAVDLTTPLDPLIAAEQVNIAQARFDPTWRTAVGTDHIDLPPASFTPDGLPVTTQRDEVEFLTRITKEWATGATTSIGYEPSLAYLFLPQGNVGGFNPSHAADIVIQGTQPLMRNGGRNTNLASIRIANVREKQSVLLLQSKLQSQLKGIVTVYWNLHASHVRHAALTEALALAEQMYRVEITRFQAGRVIYADVARVGVNKEGLIQQRLETERIMQRQTYQLSQIAGFPIAPSAVLYPTDTPIHEAPILDLDGILALALSRNPTLLIQKNDLCVIDNELQVARNQLKPQLDLKSAVRSGGLNDDFGSALKDAAQVEFVNVAVGVEYSRPIGNRSAQAKYRQLQLSQSRNANLLTAFEENVAYEIAEKANSAKIEYAKFESALRRLAEAQEWVRLSKARYENPPDELGSDALLIALIDYQNAIQARVDALFITAQTLADYNTALCEIEELEGVLLNNWGITFFSETNASSPVETQPYQSSLPQVGEAR